MQSPEAKLELLQSVNRNSVAKLSYWNKEAICLYANEPYLEWIGKTREDVEAGKMDTIVPDHPDSKAYLAKAILGEKLSHTYCHTYPGPPSHYRINYFPDIIGGDVRGCVVQIDDITDLYHENEAISIKNNQIEELIKSNTDLKQFSFITSHNLRAPLSNIIGLLAYLETDTLDPGNQEIMSMISSAAEKLSETIRDLTNILVIKNTAVPTSSIDVEQIFHMVNHNFLQAEKEIGAIIELQFNVSHVDFNESYLESIFINLISNAIKYRHQERTLKITVTTNYSGKRVLLSFSDNGLGIDLDKHSTRLFGMYQRFHPNTEGQGLGLFIIKSQIDALGGSVEIRSKVEEGTQFLITLPL